MTKRRISLPAVFTKKHLLKKERLEFQLSQKNDIPRLLALCMNVQVVSFRVTFYEAVISEFLCPFQRLKLQRKLFFLRRFTLVLPREKLFFHRRPFFKRVTPCKSNWVLAINPWNMAWLAVLLISTALFFFVVRKQRLRDIPFYMVTQTSYTVYELFYFLNLFRAYLWRRSVYL